MELTIKEIQDKKTEAERQIAKILIDLISQTGCNIKDVSLNSEYYTNVASSISNQVVRSFTIEMSI